MLASQGIIEYIKRLEIIVKSCENDIINKNSDYVAGPETRSWWKTCLHILHRMHVSLPYHVETNIHTSLVVLCGRFGWYSEMMELYNLMLQDGVEPNAITWNACRFLYVCIMHGI